MQWVATAALRAYLSPMSSLNFIVVLSVGVMVAVIVAVDVLVFRGYFWARLLSNIGIVLLFTALYLRFLR